MRPGLTVSLALLAAAGCGAAPVTRLEPATGVTASIALQPQAKGTLWATWLTTAELAKLGSGDPPMMLIRDLVTRSIVVGDVASHPTMTFTVHPSPGKIVVMATVDASHTGLLSLFGAGAGTVHGMSTPIDFANATVDAGPIKLDADPQPREREHCKGDRFALEQIEAPEVAGTVGNSTTRRACVHLPLHYAEHPERHYPVVYGLPGLSSTDDAVAEYKLELDDAILVAVDTRTKTGSTYFVDSPTSGKWETFFTKSLVPYIDAHYRTLPTSSARGLVGHSTGGFNAVSIGLRHPELFGVIAAASPDGLDFAVWFGSPRPWIRDFARVEHGLGGAGQFISYAADWSPSASGYDWPLDGAGAIIDGVMKRWLEQSPATWLKDPKRVASLKRFSGKILLAVGDTDEFDLKEPTEAFSHELTAVGIDNQLLVAHGGHGSTEGEPMRAMSKFLLEQLDHAH